VQSCWGPVLQEDCQAAIPTRRKTLVAFKFMDEASDVDSSGALNKSTI
jgi:hypothetical protein